jgi:hypothetical protein
MAVCKFCGCEFDVSDVRRSIGRRYGAGVYNDYYPDGDVCESCAVEEIGCDYATGAEIKELMGIDSWDD